MQIPSLKEILSKHRLFFALCGLFVVAGSLLLLFIPKGSMILFFSGQRTPFWNTFFKSGTRFGEEIMYLASLFLLLFIRYRHALAIPLLGIIVTLAAFVSKWIFHINRPGAWFKEQGLLDTVQLVEDVRLNMGPTSFPSGHTMSAFALYTFLVLCSKQKTSLSILLFLLAAMIGISRVYLVQHFWQDIPAGAFLGVVLALILYYNHWQWGQHQTNSWLDEKLKFPKWSKEN